MSGISYKNELLIAISFMILLGAFFYKQSVVSPEGSAVNESVSILQEIKESVALKALWGDKKTTKKIDKLKNGISASQLKWSRKGKKLTASFKSLSANQLNKMIKQLMNTAVEIQRLHINKLGASYTLELKCKW